MFKKISNEVFENTDGYTINNNSHFELQYIEGNRIARIICEPSMQCDVYYLSLPIKWKPPYDTEVIEAEKQELIRQRVLALLNFRGIKFSVA